MTITRQHLFEYMDLATRGQYLAHRKEHDKNINRWKLTNETASLLMQAEEIAWDTETSQALPGTYKYLTKAIRNKLGLTYLTDVTHVVFYAIVGGEEVAVVLVAPFTDHELAFVRLLFGRKDCLFIGHNHGFDLRIFCGHHDIPVPERTYCTLVGQTTMIGGPKEGYPGGFRRGLESLIEMYDVFDYVAEVDPRVTPEWLAYMKKNRKKLHTLPADDVTVYVVTDGVSTYRVYRAQMYWSKVLHEQWGYDALWDSHKEDQQYQNILSRWTVRGMPINREWIKQQLVLIQAERERLLPFFIEWGCGSLSKDVEKFRFVFHVCESPLPDPWYWVDFKHGRGKWYPADMQHDLWTEAAGKNIPKTGWKEDTDYSNWYSTGAKAIRYYLKFGPEQHRSKLKLYAYYTQMVSQESTYREWLDHSEYDGKVHPMLTQSANTGRTNGSTPNPLNVNMDAPDTVEVYDPISGGISKVTQFTGRGMFAPHPGKVLMEFDASNAEVRLAAVIAKANNLAEAFEEGRDLHKENASYYFLTPYSEVTYVQRFESKGVFFAKQYGGGDRKITSAVYLPLDMVQEMNRNWDEVNWEIQDAKDKVEDDGMRSYRKMQSFPLEAFRQAYTVLWNGRWVPAPTYGGKPKLYPLWNTQQQGGVGRIVSPAIIAMQGWIDEHPEAGVDMYLMIHDSTILEVPEDDEVIAREAGSFMAKELMTQIPYEMTIVNGHKVPWPSGCDLHENSKKWGWRPGQEFPYYCGEDEGEVVITFPEDEAWKIMREKAVARTEHEMQEQRMKIQDLETTVVCDTMPWCDGEVVEPAVAWEVIATYAREDINTQARFWSKALNTPDAVPEHVREDVTQFVEWARDLDTLEQDYYELERKLEELNDN